MLKVIYRAGLALALLSFAVLPAQAQFGAKSKCTDPEVVNLIKDTLKNGQGDGAKAHQIGVFLLSGEPVTVSASSSKVQCKIRITGSMRGVAFRKTGHVTIKRNGSVWWSSIRFGRR